MTAGEELPFAGFVELFARIVPCRLEHPVARDGAVALSGNERLGDEAEQRIDDCGHGEIGACRNRLGGFEAERAAEDRKPPQNDTLGFGEQPIAPVERRPQCLVPRQGRSPTGNQQIETVVEAGGYLPDAERGGKRRRQIAATIMAVFRSGAKCGSAARARSMNRRTAPECRISSRSAASSAGTVSGGTG